MALSNDLISQFVKVTKDEKKKSTETTTFGTIVKYEGSTWVKLDGSDLLTPVSSTVETEDGDRVTVLVKDHTATVTGDLSTPAANSSTVENIGSKISEFEIVIADTISAETLGAYNATIENLRAVTARYDNMETVNAEIENLEAKIADLDYVTASDIEAINADIEHIEALFGEFDNISAEDLEVVDAEIVNLKAYTADFTYVSTDVLKAMKADIKELNAEKISVEQADLKYANIDFSNIGSAAMEYFYATSGLIENVVVGDGSITGRLVGVTIIGDTIEAGTLVADKLVIQGEDGLYYKLNTNGITTSAEQTDYNSLNGKIITAKSITATQISVSDLVAFDATIGGFTITDNAIYSEVKDSDNNATRGVYFGSDGQINIGDDNNFIKYYLDEDGTYKLAISAASVMYALNGKQHSLEDLGSIGEYVHIGTYEDEPCIELGESDSDFRLVITNTRILFMEETSVPAYITNQSLHITKAVIEEEIRQGQFIWTVRGENGDKLGLMWKEVTE